MICINVICIKGFYNSPALICIKTCSLSGTEGTFLLIAWSAYILIFLNIILVKFSKRIPAGRGKFLYFYILQNAKNSIGESVIQVIRIKWPYHLSNHIPPFPTSYMINLGNHHDHPGRSSSPWAITYDHLVTTRELSYITSFERQGRVDTHHVC